MESRQHLVRWTNKIWKETITIVNHHLRKMLTFSCWLRLFKFESDSVRLYFEVVSTTRHSTKVTLSVVAVLPTGPTAS